MLSNTVDFAQTVEIKAITEKIAAARPVSAGDKRAPRRTKLVSVIAIGLPGDYQIEGIALTRAAKPRDVIEMLRVLDFGLLLVSAGPEEGDVWQMVQTVRRYWPGLRWALLSEDCTDHQEILARSLGAASVTADHEVILELAGKRRHYR